MLQIAVTVGLMVRDRSPGVVRATPNDYLLHHPGHAQHWPIPLRCRASFQPLLRLWQSCGVLFLTKTWSGWAIRAASDDLDSASLVGINPTKTYALSFGLGSAVTALGGALIITFQQVDPTMGMRFGLLSWAILALAGLGSIPGLLIAGVIVGTLDL
jgi:ABC-type uncharacterized transport system permease subunit